MKEKIMTLVVDFNHKGETKSKLKHSNIYMNAHVLTSAKCCSILDKQISKVYDIKEIL